MELLRITEIFFSLQGETSTVGIPTVFIRLTGCPLRCKYCDTPYAFYGGQKQSIPDILLSIQQYHTHYITVTGGEPLAQPACLPFMAYLCDHNYHVSLETSGALDISKVDPRVIKIVDIKTPSSGEMVKNRWDNLSCLLPQDELKFVITDQADYGWSKQIIEQYHLFKRCHILFSPVHDVLSSKSLAQWILNDQLPVRLQIQLHKYLWGNAPGH